MLLVISWAIPISKGKAAIIIMMAATRFETNPITSMCLQRLPAVISARRAMKAASTRMYAAKYSKPLRLSFLRLTSGMALCSIFALSSL